MAVETKRRRLTLRPIFFYPAGKRYPFFVPHCATGRPRPLAGPTLRPRRHPSAGVEHRV